MYFSIHGNKMFYLFTQIFFVNVCHTNCIARACTSKYRLASYFYLLKIFDISLKPLVIISGGGGECLPPYCNY